MCRTRYFSYSVPRSDSSAETSVSANVSLSRRTSSATSTSVPPNSRSEYSRQIAKLRLDSIMYLRSQELGSPHCSTNPDGAGVGHLVRKSPAAYDRIHIIEHSSKK